MYFCEVSFDFCHRKCHYGRVHENGPLFVRSGAPGPPPGGPLNANTNNEFVFLRCVQLFSLKGQLTQTSRLYAVTSTVIYIMLQFALRNHFVTTTTRLAGRNLLKYRHCTNLILLKSKTPTIRFIKI